MLSSNDGKRCDTFFKIHCGVGTDRGVLLLKKKLTFDMNLDTFITYTVPTALLIQRHSYEGSNSRKSEHRRAATKAGEMKYFTLSPGSPPTSSEVFCSTFRLRL